MTLTLFTKLLFSSRRMLVPFHCAFFFIVAFNDGGNVFLKLHNGSELAPFIIHPEKGLN